MEQVVNNPVEYRGRLADTLDDFEEVEFAGEYIHCCGISEIHGIQGVKPEHVIITMVEGCSANDYHDGALYVRPAAVPLNIQPFHFFSSNNGDGEKLTKFIRRHKLGRVYQSQARFNPTGSPKLRMFMWEPDGNAMVKWYQKFRAVYDKKRKEEAQ